MNIYFAGAIRGGRDDSKLYTALIDHLKKSGPVLTEHVGDEALLLEEGQLTEHQIFERDMAWLAKADVVIAEVTTPSLGVGYELGVAQSLGKKVLCLFRPRVGRSLSAMVAGNRLFNVQPYREFSEACDLIAAFFAEV